MAYQIVKQPNGLYALWSTCVDDFAAIDCLPAEIVKVLLDEQRALIKRKVKNVVVQLAAGGKPYCQFTRTFGECVAIIKRTHGKNTESLRMMRQGGLIP